MIGVSTERDEDRGHPAPGPAPGSAWLRPLVQPGDAGPAESEPSGAEREALVRLSQVGRACAMVAHEIGNPLAAIKATLQSIEQEAAAAGLGDTLDAVFREVDRLDHILSQLLGFVRHRAPRRTRASLVEIVARAR